MLLVVSLMHTAKPAGLRSTQLRQIRAAAGLKQSQLLLLLEQAGHQLRLPQQLLRPLVSLLPAVLVRLGLRRPGDQELRPLRL